MKKYLSIRINLFISITIVVGFLSAALINFSAYSSIIKDDIENISKLTSTNIYSDINNELIKPIYVSLTMANDSFLKNWLMNEESTQNSAYLLQLKDYLGGIREKYGYDSVFLISDKTKVYYYYDGVNKIISPENEHDVWYYDFINEDVSYKLDVDHDEVAGNALTVFINCRMEDAAGNVLGVVGVGIKMNELQKTLASFEENFNLNAFLVSPDGLIQAHSDNTKIEKENYFGAAYVTSIKNEIMDNKSSMETFAVERDHLDGYIISRYIPEFDWFLIVEKDVSVLTMTFRTQMINDLIIIGIVLILLLVVSTGLINRYKRQINKISGTDELTRLPNRRAFNEHLDGVLKENKRGDRSVSVFIFDIDDFKIINDNRGHLAGDMIMKQVCTAAREILGDAIYLSRWGGDEFAGIVYEEAQTAADICRGMMTGMRNREELSAHGITVSIGLTQALSDDGIDSVMSRADKGLYTAKKSGKNRVYIV